MTEDWNVREDVSRTTVAQHGPTRLRFMLLDRQLWVAEESPEVFGHVTPAVETALDEVRPGLCSEARRTLEACLV